MIFPITLPYLSALVALGSHNISIKQCGDCMLQLWELSREVDICTILIKPKKIEAGLIIVSLAAHYAYIHR